jgi:NAD(P)-dependent dehydrogenase (short-subunit alcohol dehydrogenase family)
VGNEPTIMPATLFGLDGRVAIVTGASAGLGARFAAVLATAGATVLCVARRRERLERLCERRAGLVAYAGDITDGEVRSTIVSSALERFGRIDVLVNNAGGGATTLAVDETLSQFRATLELNLVALFDLARLVAPHMTENGRGSIVNIASTMGLVAAAPIPNASYCAAKGAVVNLTRELACQWARQGVRVNAIAPGFFPSEMTEAMESDERVQGFIRRNCPVGRMGRPGELDGAILFLASDASTYCTGQVLTVDGGWTAR